MIPQILATLLFGSAAAFLAFCVIDSTTRRLASRSWLASIAFVAAAIMWRLPWRSEWFHGLEYEDAYVYAVAGRQMLLDVDPPRALGESAFLTTVCAVGSMLECTRWETYSGHYLGLPNAIAALGRVTGFFPQIASVVSLLATTLNVIVLHWLGCIVFSPQSRASLVAPILLAVTPAFAVIGTGGSAEPLSSALMTVALYLFVRFAHPSSEPSNRFVLLLNWAALLSALTYACVTKRENLIAVLLMPLVALTVHLRTRGGGTGSRLASVIVLSLMVALFAAVALQVGDNFTQERGEFGRFPFSIELARTMFPSFIGASLDPHWFGITGLLGTIGLAVGVRRTPLVAYPAALLLGYLALYATHVRSYYQVTHGAVYPFDTLRYGVNLMGFWALLGAAGWDALARWFGQYAVRVPRLCRQLAAGCALAGLFALTVNLRADLTADERASRIAPVELAMSTARAEPGMRFAIITPEPLLLQLYGPPDLQIASLYAMDRAALAEFMASNADATVVYLAHAVYDNPVERMRRGAQLEAVTPSISGVVARDEAATLYRLAR